MTTNSPIDMLRAEHRVIERALDLLLALTRADELDVDAGRDAVAFLRGFADELHHGKEEHRLFPLLEERGLPRHAGPLAVMLHEHEQGRGAIAAMDAALDAGDATAFKRAAEGYVALLRDHIAKEDGVLFPMADSMLDDPTRARLTDEFAQVNQELGKRGAELRERVEALAEAMNLPPTAASSHGGMCGFGGCGGH